MKVILDTNVYVSACRSEEARARFRVDLNFLPRACARHRYAPSRLQPTAGLPLSSARGGGHAQNFQSHGLRRGSGSGSATER
jgi:hypothetical protein